ncbi:MAG: ferritin-like domain-containing protein [Myxococcota bacterium]
MSPAARRRALRAAAAVAALGSCAPRSAPPPEAPAAIEEAKPGPTLDVDACLAATTQAEQEDRIDGVLDCCRALDDHFSAEMRRDISSDVLGQWPARNACCEAIGWGPGLACTPWGPPTPPTSAAAVDRGPLDLRTAANAGRIPVPDVPAHLRDATLATWRARMEQEYGSADVFRALASQLAAAGLDPSVVTEVAAFADEEHRHGELCGAVVASFGGEAVGRLPPAPPYPLHPDVDPLEGALRNLVSICCLSETVAVALIGAEREDMPEGPLRDLLTSIWADEIGHARTGWRLLAELLPLGDAGLADRLAAWLPEALAHLEDHELAHLPESATFGPEGAPYGLCNGPAARALFHETVADVVVPGLQRLGIVAEA